MSDDFASLRDPIPSDAMAQLSKLAARQLEAEQVLADAEKAVKVAKKRLADVAERELPGLMDQLEIADFTTKDGLRIVVAEKLYFSVPKDKREQAYDWLVANDLGGAIRHHVGADFPVDEAEEAHRAQELMVAQGYHVEVDRKMAPATMGSVLREQLAAGEDVPLDLFGATRVRKSTIKQRGD